MLNRFWIRTAACWLSSSATILQSAKADIFDDLEVHGFATQGYVKTSDNSFFGDSEQGSFEFYELGVNATMEPSPSVRLSGQLLARRAGEMYSGTPIVDFAVADLTLHNTESSAVGMLLGRIKNPLGIFNETRDVAFTRPGIFLPQVVYYDKVRNLIMSSDGAGLRVNMFGPAANLTFYAAAGKPVIDENVEHGFLGAGFSGDLVPDGVSSLARVSLEAPNERVLAAISIAESSMEFNSGPRDPMGNGKIGFTYGIASVQFSQESWTFTAEYMREPTKWTGFSPSIFDGMKAAAEGYYAQLAWVVSEDLELMVRYGESFADRDDKSGERFSKKTYGLVPAHTRYSKIFTSGIRWDVTQNLMMRVEYQSHHGTFILSSRENPNPSDLEPNWDMFSLSASYRF